MESKIIIYEHLQRYKEKFNNQHYIYKNIGYFILILLIVKNNFITFNKITSVIHIFTLIVKLVVSVG